MRWLHVVTVLLMATVWSACSSTHWVHPTKKEEFLTYDWNQCERDWLNKMAVNRILIIQIVIIIILLLLLILHFIQY